MVDRPGMYRFCGLKLTPWSVIDVAKTKRLAVLVMCGSFNPFHQAHSAMYDAAQDVLTTRSDGEVTVVGGFVSPVNDLYGKKDLHPFLERAAICAASVANHPKLVVDEWEGLQSVYTRTVFVLEHLQREVQNWYEVDAAPGKAQLLWVRQHPVNVMLLCGCDLFASFWRPGCWSLDSLNSLLGQFELVVVRRAGTPSCDALLDEGGSKLQEIVEMPDGSTRVVSLDLSTYVFTEVELFPNVISSSLIRKLLEENPEADLGDYVPAKAEHLVRTYYTKRT